jgi:hypothetical protein
VTFIPLAICHPQLSHFVLATRAGSAAVGGEYYVVHYERGGIAHTFHILVARLMKNDANRRWFGSVLEVRSKTTPRFSTHYEVGSWTTVWITRIE